MKARIFGKVKNGWHDIVYLYNKYTMLKELVAGIKEQPQTVKDKTVVFNPVRSTTVNYDVELFLAYQLALKGIKVKVFVDDGLMLHWDIEQVHNLFQGRFFDPYKRFEEKEKSVLSNIREFKNSLLLKAQIKLYVLAYRHPNLEVINYSDFIDGNVEDLEPSEYDRHQAFSSTKRFFENGQVDLNRKDHKQFFQKSLTNALISKKLGLKIIEQISPDLFITSHGIYSTWGPCYQVMKERGIKTLIWEMHFSKRKKIVLVDDIIQLISNDSDWQRKRGVEIDECAIKKVQQEFDTRISHKSLDTSIYFNGHFNAGNYETPFLERAKKGTVFGLFPNVYWDGNIYERNKVFDDLVEWIEFTINMIKDTENTLIIRFHPSEATLQRGAKPLEEILKKRNNHVANHKNIHFIPADSGIDTYALARKYVDIGLIYSGTLALELTYMDIPVISCSKSFYNNAGFCFEPQTPSEYAELLGQPNNIKNMFSKNNKTFRSNLVKFSHWYFNDIAYDLPIFDPQHIYKFCYEELEPKDIDPQKNKGLLATITKILDSFAEPVESPNARDHVMSS